MGFIWCCMVSPHHPIYGWYLSSPSVLFWSNWGTSMLSSLLTAAVDFNRRDAPRERDVSTMARANSPVLGFACVALVICSIKAWQGPWVRERWKKVTFTAWQKLIETYSIIEIGLDAGWPYSSIFNHVYQCLSIFHHISPCWTMLTHVEHWLSPYFTMRISWDFIGFNSPHLSMPGDVPRLCGGSPAPTARELDGVGNPHWNLHKHGRT